MQSIAATTLAIAATAALALGCQPMAAQTGGDKNTFIGHWAGKNRFRSRIEVRVDDIGDDQTVNGTACWWNTAGVIFGQRLEHVARLSETGLSIRFDIGRGSFHVHRTGERKAVLWETRLRSDGTLTRPLRTRLARTRKDGCAQRYSAEAAAPPASASDATPIVGHWTGQWNDGRVGEMNVTSADAKGNVEGMYCTRSDTGEIAIYDLLRRGALNARHNARQATVTFEQKLRHRRKRRFRFEASDREHARLTVTREHRGATLGSTTLAMSRGASPQGCAAYTRTLPAGADTSHASVVADRNEEARSK